MVRKILFLGVPMALLATSAAASDIVLNGGFTSGDLTDWTTNTCSDCSGAGWNVGGFPANPGTPPPDTTFAATVGCDHGPCNNPDIGDWIEQSLATVPLESYTLTFFFDPGEKSYTELEVLWNGSVVTGGEIINAPSSTWEEYIFPDLTASDASTVLEFTGRDNRGKRLYLTDISVDLATPEPPSLLPMTGGLLAMGTILFRRRKA
jgi:hypothetical protein